MTDTTIQSLFNEISTISSSYAKIRKANGENFNLFQILGMTSNEVKTHSRFIAELLNPKGSHDMGDVFLRLFIEQLNAAETHFDTNNGETLTRHFHGFSSYKGESAIVEAYAGKVTETDGGRIDILVNCSEGRKIIIENKIYAGDQKLQMIRYDTYGRSTGKEYKLIYLTLDGKQPSDESKGALINDHHYACISYQDDIVEWLEKCRKEAVIHTPLRESITQYINLIGYLTGSTANSTMKNELIETITKNKQSFAAALEIAGVVEEAKQQVYYEFAVKLKERIHQKVNGLVIEVNSKFGDKWKRFDIRDATSENPHLNVSLTAMWDKRSFYIEIIDQQIRQKSPSRNINIEIFKKELKSFSGEPETKVAGNIDRYAGEWLCWYWKFENKFDKMLGNDEELIETVSDDLIRVYNAYLKRT